MGRTKDSSFSGSLQLDVSRFFVFLLTLNKKAETGISQSKIYKLSEEKVRHNGARLLLPGVLLKDRECYIKRPRTS